MTSTNRKIWFPAKRYGWGWGWPVAWQGWVVLVLFALGIIASAWLAPPHRSPFAVRLRHSHRGIGRAADCRVLAQGRETRVALGQGRLTVRLDTQPVRSWFVGRPLLPSVIDTPRQHSVDRLNCPESPCDARMRKNGRVREGQMLASASTRIPMPNRLRPSAFPPACPAPDVATELPQQVPARTLKIYPNRDKFIDGSVHQTAVLARFGA